MTPLHVFVRGLALLAAVAALRANPTVSITSPANGASLGGDTSITVSVTAAPSSGYALSSVELRANGATVGTSLGAGGSFAWAPPAAGTYVLTAVATDTSVAVAGGNSNLTTSAAITVAVTAATAGPSVTLAMASSASLPVGSTRALTATAIAPAGVARVELLYDGSIMAIDTTSPYNFLFTAPTVPGSHSISARVVDTLGVSAMATPVALTIADPIGAAPLVAALSPGSGAFVAPTAAAVISGTASDPDGTVSAVRVYIDGLLLGSATLSGTSWSIPWITPAAGSPTITVVATDANLNATATTVGVTVADAASPDIALGLSPVNAGASASTTLPVGAVRNIVATVTPASGRAVVRTEFFVDGTKVAEDTQAPFTYRYLATPLASGEATHTHVVSVRATDNAGASRDVFLPLTVVSPVGSAPAVNLLTPADGATVVPGSAVSLAATAVSTGGAIASVQFFANGNPASLNSGAALTVAPYVATFTPASPGRYVLDAIATDDRGNTAVSNSVTITASFSSPTIVFTAPNPNATVRAAPGVPLTMTVVPTVGQGSSVLLVEFLVDGVQVAVRTTATNATLGAYTATWTPTAAQIGAHVLTARVTDTNSQSANTAALNLTVANAVGTPPTITISTNPIPTLGLQSLSTVNFIANAFANGTGSSLSGVEFFLNETSIGAATREQSSNIYRLTYDLSRFDLASLVPTDASGVIRYTLPLYAIARDSNGNQTVSAVQTLNIVPSTSAPPTVQASASATSVTQGASVLVTPTFADTDGSIVQMQLYANGSLVSSAANPETGQSLAFTASTAGRFNLYVAVTDDTGNTAISTPALVVTVGAITAPTTAITRPADNDTTTTVGASVFLEGTAVNSDSTQVPSLVFIATGSSGTRATVTGTRVGTTTTYRATWVPATPDTYTLTTQASVGTVSGTSPTSRRVVVNNVSGLAPTVTLTTPTSATISSTTVLRATAQDSDGAVTSVEFFVNRYSVGQATREQLTNTWVLATAFAGLSPGSVEVVAMARDNSGNIATSTTNTINLTAGAGTAPLVTIAASTTDAPFSQPIALTANARDSDGTVTSVQYFANGTSLGTATNATTSYHLDWTPTLAGVYDVYAIATDNTGNTSVAASLKITVRANNPVVENSAFVLQTYRDIANTGTINPLVFANLTAQLDAGTLTRAELVVKLMADPAFEAPVQLLATYYVLMGQWPSPQNYQALLTTARTSLGDAAADILSANEYFAKYGIVPTVEILENPASALPANTFIPQLWSQAGLGTASVLANLQFRNNDTQTATVGRGYNVVGLADALAEFIVYTNSQNTALWAKARAAALFYQLDQPPVTMTTDEIAARIATLTQVGDTQAIADAVLKDVLYGYRYVTITRQPESIAVSLRSGALFRVEAAGAPPLTYQWLLNGAPIAGGTASTLSVTNVDTSRVGAYTVIVSSSLASATSDAATLKLASTPTQLMNVSTRGLTAAGEDTLIAGFVVTGTGTQTRQMLIRVVGPGLGALGVAGFLDNPRLELYSGSSANPIASNDDWESQTGSATTANAIAQAASRAGAFALESGAKDAAILTTLPPGAYTVQAKAATGAATTSGVVLVEVYDVTTGSAAGPKAANIATRGRVGADGSLLIAGFSVSGGAARRMLIRGVGPTLQSLGLGAASLADPEITLLTQPSGQVLRTNNDWSTSDDAALIASAAATAGAFSLANGSKDAAMLVMLPPGAYTVQLRGAQNTTGIGIVEVYDVDP